MGPTSPDETLMSESGRDQKVPEGGEGEVGSAESVREGKEVEWQWGGGELEVGSRVILQNMSCCPQLWGCKLMRS